MVVNDLVARSYSACLAVSQSTALPLTDGVADSSSALVSQDQDQEPVPVFEMSRVEEASGILNRLIDPKAVPVSAQDLYSFFAMYYTLVKSSLPLRDASSNRRMALCDDISSVVDEILSPAPAGLIDKGDSVYSPQRTTAKVFEGVYAREGDLLRSLKNLLTPDVPHEVCLAQPISDEMVAISLPGDRSVDLLKEIVRGTLHVCAWLNRFPAADDHFRLELDAFVARGYKFCLIESQGSVFDMARVGELTAQLNIIGRRKKALSVQDLYSFLLMYHLTAQPSEPVQSASSSQPLLTDVAPVSVLASMSSDAAAGGSSSSRRSSSPSSVPVSEGALVPVAAAEVILVSPDVLDKSISLPVVDEASMDGDDSDYKAEIEDAMGDSLAKSLLVGMVKIDCASDLWGEPLSASAQYIPILSAEIGETIKIDGEAEAGVCLYAVKTGMRFSFYTKKGVDVAMPAFMDRTVEKIILFDGASTK